MLVHRGFCFQLISSIFALLDFSWDNFLISNMDCYELMYQPDIIDDGMVIHLCFRIPCIVAFLLRPRFLICVILNVGSRGFSEPDVL